MTEDTYEVVLGSDKFGAKFIYFPLFLENDLRVYRHSIDNTILSTVKVRKFNFSFNFIIQRNSKSVNPQMLTMGHLCPPAKS